MYYIFLFDSYHQISIFFNLQNDLRLTCQHHPANSAGWDGLEGRESLRAGSLQRGTPLPGQGESFLTGDFDCLQQNCCGFHQKGSPMGQNS